MQTDLWDPEYEIDLLEKQDDATQLDLVTLLQWDLMAELPGFEADAER